MPWYWYLVIALLALNPCDIIVKIGKPRTPDTIGPALIVFAVNTAFAAWALASPWRWYTWVVLAYLAFGTVMQFVMVGRPRKPYTVADAILSGIVNLAIIAGIVWVQHS